MSIIFNIYGLLQAIIALAILGIIHLLINALGFDYDLLGGSKEAFISLLILTLSTAYLDIKGIKGKLFFLPTWIVLLIGSIVTFKLNYHTETFQKNQYYLYAVAMVIVVLYIIFNKKEIRKNWLKRNEVLELLKIKISQNTLSQSEYWKIASHLFFKPSFLFLNLPQLWTKIYKNTYTEDEFLAYYKDFVNTISIDSIPIKRNISWITDLKESLNSANTFSEFEPPMLCFSRLASTIDYMNSKLS